MKLETPFSRAVDRLAPGARGTAIAALLDAKAARTVALNWKAGRRQPPRWALELLARKLRARGNQDLAIAAELEAIPERLGLRAGAKNLAAYLARRR